MTITRSPGWIDSSPRGTIIRSPRMMRRDLRVRRDDGVLQQPADRRVRLRAPRNVELDHQDLALGEDVGLPRRRNADDPCNRVRRLELRGHDEVDVELSLSPDLEVLDVLRADDRPRFGSEPLGEDPGDDVDLVALGTGDHEVGVLDPGLQQAPSAGAISFEREDVVAIRERAQPNRVGVDDGDRVLGSERLDDRRPDLPGPDHENPHAGGLCIIGAS